MVSLAFAYNHYTDWLETARLDLSELEEIKAAFADRLTQES